MTKKKTNGAPTPIADGTEFKISPLAAELFEQEKGLQIALRIISAQLSRVNKRVWEEVFAEYPQLEELPHEQPGFLAVYDENKSTVAVRDFNNQEEEQTIDGVKPN